MLLLAMGDHQKADRLMEHSLRHMQGLSSGSAKEYGIFKARIHALRRQQEAALVAMREAIESGWTFQWWWYMGQDPAFEFLRDAPEFNALLDRMNAEMARQLAEARRGEARGEIALPPGE